MHSQAFHAVLVRWVEGVAGADASLSTFCHFKHLKNKKTKHVTKHKRFNGERKSRFGMDLLQEKTQQQKKKNTCRTLALWSVKTKLQFVDVFPPTDYRLTLD